MMDFIQDILSFCVQSDLFIYTVISSALFGAGALIVKLIYGR